MLTNTPAPGPIPSLSTPVCHTVLMASSSSATSSPTSPLDSPYFIVGSLLVFPFVAGLLPRFFKAKKFPNLFTALACFSAGVFLSLLLCHVIPEAIEKQISLHSEISPQDQAFFEASPEDHSHGAFVGSFLCGLVYLGFLVFDGVYGHSMLEGAGNSDSSHCHHHHHHEHVHGAVGEGEKAEEGSNGGKVSNFRALLFVAVLSLHSALEGFMEIGKQMLLGMLLHKILEIFAIGTSLMQTKLKAVTYVALVAFSAALTPLTHILFLAIESSIKESFWKRIIFIVLNALSTGAICFATFGECIPHEIEKNSPSLGFRMGFILFGYIATSFLGLAHSH